MSYILDSLKKSEQQRRRSEQPGLHSEPLGSAARRRKERRVWPYLLLVALLVNAVVFGWYLASSRDNRLPAQESGPTTVQADPTRQPAPPVSNREQEFVSQVAEPAPMPKTVVEPLPAGNVVIAPPEVEADDKPVAARKQAAGTGEPIPVTQLPAAVRRELPELVLSLHYFSGAKGSSMIRLDGVILRVGDPVQDGLSVRDIVAEGVVLDYRGRLVWLDRPRG